VTAAVLGKVPGVAAAVGGGGPEPALRDTTATPRLVVITALAAVVGCLSAGAAWVLVRLIGTATNAFWYGRASDRLTVPDPRHLGLWSILLPVAGGLVVGVIARFGSERVRGHGTPETIEAVMVHGSRVQPRLAVLKPLSAAVAIGTGGPFGAEGPIIATGGALGSLVAQLLTLTADERKALLVAGAVGGMSAVFGTPVAAVLFAVELLLYEYRAASLVPVAVASVVADLLRGPLLGRGQLFPAPAPPHLSALGDLGCVGFGIVTGLVAVVATAMVSRSEQLFEHVPVHWMWWPAIGGLVIGIGGLVVPDSLGVGYPTIGVLLTGHGGVGFAAGLLAVKAVIWAVGLGSGTSGGVVAPVLHMGCSLGAVAAGVLPAVGAGVWPLLGMAALLAAMLRAPLTAVVFALELSQRPAALPALLLTAVPAYAVTAVVVRRGILTERMDRRGYHLRTELDVDPLEVLLVRDVLADTVTTLPADLPLREAARIVAETRAAAIERDGVHQRLFPVVDGEGRLLGVLRRRVALDAVLAGGDEVDGSVLDVADRDPVLASPGETLRTVANRMAEHGVTRLPVVAADGTVVGVVSLAALLAGRLRDITEARDLRRLIDIRVTVPLPGGRVRHRGARVERPAPPGPDERQDA
jgi:chloride channel protein, CIC family